MWGRPAAAMLHGSGTSRPVAGSSVNDSFRIAGSVGGLYPGGTAALVLTLSNTAHFAIVVTSVTTQVASPEPGCSGSYLTVEPFAGARTVPAEGTAQITVPVVLSHAAPDPCQGAVFPLAYSGLARKA